MPDEGTLRKHAAAALGEGRLPLESADRIWAGPGIGVPCTVCDLPVTANQMEFEIQFARDGDNGGWLHACHLHVRCFAAWELERDAA